MKSKCFRKILRPVYIELTADESVPLSCLLQMKLGTPMARNLSKEPGQKPPHGQGADGVGLLCDALAIERQGDEEQDGSERDGDCHEHCFLLSFQLAQDATSNRNKVR